MKDDNKRLKIVIFAAYTLFILYLLFFWKRHPTSMNYLTWLKIKHNFVPFVTIRRFISNLINYPTWHHFKRLMVNIVGNIVMFVPFGFFLPWIFDKCRRFWRTMLYFGAGIVTVELAQLFTTLGNCDIDDVILNMAGAALGYGVYKLLERKGIIK